MGEGGEALLDVRECGVVVGGTWCWSRGVGF